MRPTLLALLIGFAAGHAHAVEPTMLSAFADKDWVAEKWNKATGSATAVGDGAEDTPEALLVEVAYSGKGFEWFTIDPTAPITVPDEATALTLWVKGGKAGYPIVVKFKDAKGNAKIGDKDMEWSIFNSEADTWQQRHFDIPADWAKPLTIYAVAFHNWDRQNDAVAVTYQIDELQAVTR